MSTVMSTTSQKWSSGFQAALLAQWSIIATTLSDKLYEAFLSGAFATPQSALEYAKDNWWMLLITGIMSTLTGGYVRGQQKVNYIGRVESGTAATPSAPVVIPPTATVVQPPSQGDK